ncbi:RrF2 family transcriptional regulator [Fundidesulfovibrio agrisoli]|uniref:RrF2 family transcriptional regulator n=1 Tax=Fundidesulfovibrio agrisoli TaxID=2922717 RepID=UPI001FADB6FE|nr:Rrf2 family transcriptional regulator [Fundidesulfovibrio agrisoli]
MKLTRAAEYAIRCVLYLSKQPFGLVVSRREIAEAMSIPQAFLGKIAQSLAKAGVVVVRQGALGGMELALPPREISLLMVVEAVDGEILVNECLSRPQDCERSSCCAVHRVWHKARAQFRQTLGAANFESLARTDSNLDPAAQCDAACTGGKSATTSKGQA